MWYLIVSIPDLCTITYFVGSFQIVLNVAQCASKFICLALLYAHFLLRILHLIVAVSQGRSNSLISTYLFGIHSTASVKMQELILLSYLSKSSFSRDCQSKANAFS